jgi:hypothetical protein
MQPPVRLCNKCHEEERAGSSRWGRRCLANQRLLQRQRKRAGLPPPSKDEAEPAQAKAALRVLAQEARATVTRPAVALGAVLPPCQVCDRLKVSLAAAERRVRQLEEDLNALRFEARARARFTEAPQELAGQVVAHGPKCTCLGCRAVRAEAERLGLIGAARAE